jgi:hypothetical protein
MRVVERCLHHFFIAVGTLVFAEAWCDSGEIRYTCMPGRSCLILFKWLSVNGVNSNNDTMSSSSLIMIMHQARIFFICTQRIHHSVLKRKKGYV